ncbi:MAG: L-2-amino-thiazoline-4-carboxylic acid hydrolase [Chromatiales bacterium]|jgi:fumarate reductase iron-sulfur subunit|nr:L-2-amino-thiazoline-4-carboxylic acid hydrolase [Chromatiales bacterium]
MNNIDEIPILLRREIEARIAAPLIEAFINEFGKEATEKVASQVILKLAEQSGEQLANRCGGNSLAHLRDGTGQWSAGGALQRDVLETTETNYDYNIVRCKYADMYKALGLEKMGALLSCGRDGKMFGGFNPKIKFKRTQTIMEGAPHCDFRLSLEDDGEQNAPT